MNNQHLLEQKAHPQGWAFLLFWKMRGWRDRRGAGVEIRQTARAIRAQNVRPHARGEGATAGATARASWVRVYQRGLWGLGRAWALGAWRLGGLGAWALGRLGDLGAWALGRLGDLGRTSLRGRGFPALGFTGAGFTGVASRRASRGLSGGLPAGFPGASRGFPWGLSRRVFPAGFSRGFSGGLFRRAFPAGFSGGRASGVGGQFFSELLALCGRDKTPPRFWTRRRE